MKLPCRSKVGSQAEVLRTVLVGGPQDVERLADIAETDVQRTKVSCFVGREFPCFGHGLKPGKIIEIARSKRMDGSAVRRFCRNHAQRPLVEQKAAPLGRKVGEVLAGVIEAGPQGRSEDESDNEHSESPAQTH